MEHFVAKNDNIAASLHELDKQLSSTKNSMADLVAQNLRIENCALEEQMQIKRIELIVKEMERGRRQIDIKQLCPTVVAASSVEPSAPTSVPKEEKKPQKPATEVKKEQKPQQPSEPKEKKQKAPPKPTAEEPPIDIRRLDLRVGKIVEVSRHPDADALYLEKIDCGEAAPRTVISGLVKFVPIEEMQNRMVVVLCNLKPVKMRGITSEAMVMCASTPDKVEVLSPPAGAVPGDLVHCDGFPREPDAQMNPKKKIFETVAPDLMTNGNLEACFKGAKLQVPGKGAILAQTLKNVNVK